MVAKDKFKKKTARQPHQENYFWDSGDSSLERYSRAIEYYQQSLNIHRDTNNRYGEANSLNNLGNIYSLLGEYSQAIDYHQRSINMQRDIGNRSGEAESLNALGNIYDALGEYLQAIDCYQQSLNIERLLVTFMEKLVPGAIWGVHITPASKNFINC